jgi:mRNA-degrading endonuclease toxin of MazEF toxin-antitoxin module
VILAGELYLADLAEAGRRPVLVVSRESLNRGGYVVIVAFTTKRLEQRRKLANCVAFKSGEFGLTSDCVAQCETISSVPVDALDLHNGPIGRLDSATLRSVVGSIGYVIESSCEPE